MNKLYCTDCGRQICKNVWEKKLQASFPVMRNVRGYICWECSQDYDKNGLLPGERGYSK